jgi:hypothetical protein
LFRSRAHWLGFVSGTWWILRRVERQVTWAVRAADLHGRALSLAETDAQVQEWLGRPLSAGELTLGAHGRTAQGARVDFSFPVQGPRGSGRMLVAALHSPEGWQLQTVVLECGQGTRVLLEGEPPVPPG